MKKNAFKNVIGFAIYLLLIFALFEVGIRVYVNNRPHYDIEMWKYGTYLKKNAKDPKLAHRHIPGKSMFLYGADISINSKGLRDREFPYKKSPGVQRILFLGDSLTLGWGVPFDKIFTKTAEKELNQRHALPVEIINTGVGNYNSEQELTYYANEGYKYNADRVLLLYFINDAEVTPVYKETTLKEKSMLCVFIWSRIKKLMTRFSLKDDYRSYYKKLYRDDNKGWKTTRESLSRLNGLVRKNGARLTVFVCPELRVFKKDYLFAEEHDKILKFFEQNGIEHIDLLPAFREKAPTEQDVWVSVEDSHPNALGHKIISESVVEFILENPIIY